MQRRTFLGAVATLAGTRWENEGYDIENADEWEPLDGGTYNTGSFTPMELMSSGEGEFAGWLIEDDDLSERTMEVFYDSNAIHLSFEGSGGDMRAGGLGSLSPDQARNLGAALYQAGEELEWRREANDADH